MRSKNSPPGKKPSTKAAPKKKRTLVPKGGNDNVRTPQYLADMLVNHFQPWGNICDPARGGGAFWDALLKLRATLPNKSTMRLFWAEKSMGIDFFEANRFGTAREGVSCNRDHFDWLITNTPWSTIARWWRRGMKLADNVAFLCLVPSVFQKKKRRGFAIHGFGIREIVYVDTPPEDTPWPQTGFSLGMVHIQRGYEGGITETVLGENPWGKDRPGDDD